MSILIKVAQLDQLPAGSRKLCEADGRRIALFNLGGEVCAIDNHCTHRDGPVGAGELHDAVITCPWHGWRFHVPTGRCLDGGTELRCYPVHVQGNDVLIDLGPDDSSNSADGIYGCLVRYGALGHIGRVGATAPVACRRGDRVVVHTDRGIELAEALEAPQRIASGSNRKRPRGELLRVATDEDNQRLDSLGDLDPRLLKECDRLIAMCGAPVSVVDAEQLLDGRTIVIYYLGEPTEKLGPVAVELSKIADPRRVQFQPIEDFATSDIDVSEQPSSADVPKRSKHELVKKSSNFLRGTIIEELEADSDRFTSDNASLLEFHGAYQQDDRDVRKAGQSPEGRASQSSEGRAGKKRSFMVRTRIPGGKLTAGQLLGKLDVCDRLADGTLRLTTRQGIQMHGVMKGDLRRSIDEINQSMLTTLGACGDVVRNVMCCPAPHRNRPVRRMMQATAAQVANYFAPRTAAYYEIWVDGEKRSEQRWESNAEPIYGPTYLPRKFKIGLALPEDNCVDVYTQDIGLLAVVEAGQLVGYNVLVGGGLGTSPKVNDTFPRLGDVMAFVPYADVLRLTTAIVQVQRDFGNRENRRRARMKYLVDEWGVDRFKEKVEQYLDGEGLDEPRPVAVHGVDDHLGWRAQGDGKFYLGLFVENGRIKDAGVSRMKAGLRAVLERFRCPIRLTPQQSLLLCDLDKSWRDEVVGILVEHGIQTHEELSAVRRHAMACPALPTCGLAITESERVLPGLLDDLETELARLSLQSDAITIGMTGCPNGCARPYTADIGLVGEAPGKYTIFVGGSVLGDRLNFVYKDMVPLKQIVRELLPLIACFQTERHTGEALGDFCHRKGLAALLRLENQPKKTTA